MRKLIADASSEHVRFVCGKARRPRARAVCRPQALSAAFLAGVLYAAATGFAGGCGVREETHTALPDSTLHYPSKLAADVDVQITFAATPGRDGSGTRFFLRDNARVFAFVDIMNPAARGTERPLHFHLVWTNPNGIAVFTRDVPVDPTGEDPVIRSSFTLDPDRRQPGRYSLQVYLHRELIARKFFDGFEQSGDVRAEIVFTGLTPDPRTGAYRDVRDSFTTGEDDRVRAYVDLVNPQARGGTELDLTLEWVDPDGVTVFSRASRLDPAGDSPSLSGSMSLAPGTRASGQYTLRVWIFGNMLIGEKTFTLL